MSNDGDAEFADRVLAIGAHRQRLKPDGKPMRALRVLAGQSQAVSERTVWGEFLPAHAGRNAYAALRTLAENGLATAFTVSIPDKQGSRTRWQITDAGRGCIESLDAA